MQDFKFHFSLPVFIWLEILIFCIIILLHNYFTNKRLLKIRGAEFKERINKNPEFEKIIHRELSGSEKIILINKHKTYYNLVKINYITIPLNIALLLLLILYKTTDNFNFSDFLNLPILLSIVVLIMQTLLYYFEGNVYKDLRSPVFRVKGKLIKIFQLRKSKALKNFVISGIEFSTGDDVHLEDLWEKCSNGDLISVEYSPFTKHIWKIEKV